MHARTTTHLFLSVALTWSGAAPAQEPLFAPTHRMVPEDLAVTTAVCLGDVDGDGDLDAITAGGASFKDQQTRLYINNGVGLFVDDTTGRIPPDDDVSFAAVLGDLDGDGDLDIMVGNARHNRLYLNDSTGTFSDATATHLPVQEHETRAIALGDVDGDGDLDALLGHCTTWSRTPDPQDRLYLNDGNGVFTDVMASQLPADADRTAAVALGDIDGDGDLDALFGTWSGFAPASNRTASTATMAAARSPTSRPRASRSAIRTPRRSRSVTSTATATSTR